MRTLAGLTVALLLLVGQTVGGQVPTVALSGVARDASGGALPGVTVKATRGTESHQTSTNTQGTFRLTGLSAGPYRLTAALAGFSTAIADGVRVDAGVVNTWNPTLEIVGAGVHSTRQPRGPDTVPVTLSRDIYRVVLDALPERARGRAIVIPSTSLLPARLTPDEEPLTTFAALPRELFDMMNTAARQAPVELRADSVPAPAQLIHPRALAMVIAPPDPFRQLEARFGVTHYLSVSQVFVTADTLDAIVFYDYMCGNICGELVALWAHRNSPSAKWTVEAKRALAIY